MRKLVRFTAKAFNSLLLLSKHQHLFYPCSSQGYFFSILPNKKVHLFGCRAYHYLYTICICGSNYASVFTFLFIKSTEHGYKTAIDIINLALNWSCLNISPWLFYIVLTKKLLVASMLMSLLNLFIYDSVTTSKAKTFLFQM